MTLYKIYTLDQGLVYATTNKKEAQKVADGYSAHHTTRIEESEIN